MANTIALVKGPTGQSGPNPIGEYAEELYEVTGDNTSASVPITANWLRQIDVAFGGAVVNTVINNTVSPPTVTLTLSANLGSGSKIHVSVRGRR